MAGVGGGVMLEVVTDSFYARHAAGNHHVIIARFTNIIKHKYNQQHTSPQLRSSPVPAEISLNI